MQKWPKTKKHVSSSPHAYIILFTWHLNFNWHIFSEIWVNVLSSLNFLSIRIWYFYTCKNVKMFNHFSLTCWKREHAIFFTYIFGQNIFKRFDNFTKFAKSILTVTWPHFLLTLPNAFKRSFEPKQFLCCFKLFIHIHACKSYWHQTEYSPMSPMYVPVQPHFSKSSNNMVNFHIIQYSIFLVSLANLVKYSFIKISLIDLLEKNPLETE